MYLKILVTAWCLISVINSEATKPEAKDFDKASKQIEVKVTEMKTAGIVSDDNVDKKLKKIQSSIDSLKKQPMTGEAEINAVSNAIKGLPELVAGIQTKNYAQTVLGSLKMIAAIAVLFPPAAPFALMGTTILGALTTVLSLFNDASKQPKEDPFQSAIQKLRIEGMKDDIASTIHTWQTMIRSVSHFEDYENNKVVISSDMATQFYSNSFKNVGIFGKMKTYIEEFCIIADHGDDAKTAENIKTCLDLVNSYIQLSIMRGLILTRMAGIVQVSEEANKGKEDLKNQLAAIRMNFIDLSRKQRELDRSILGFLTNPLNSFDSKLVIYEMYRTPYKFKICIAYLRTLDQEFQNMIDDSNVILCSEEKLGGLCRQQGVGADYVNWNYDVVSTKSWFIPEGLTLTFKDTSDKKYGPFIGTNVYSPKTVSDLNKFKVEKASAKSGDARDYVMICNEDEWCDSVVLDYVQAESGLKIDKYHGVDYSLLKSIYVPEGFKVDAYGRPDGSDKNKRHTGPIYGPFRQEAISKCYTHWNILSLAPITSEMEDGARMVEVCSPDTGFCIQAEGGKTLSAEETSWYDIFSANPVECTPTKLSSLLTMRIPQGRRVTIMKGDESKNAKVGPFTGPTTLRSIPIAYHVTIENLWLPPKSKKKMGIEEENMTDKDRSNKENTSSTSTSSMSKFSPGWPSQALSEKLVSEPSRSMESLSPGQERDETPQKRHHKFRKYRPTSESTVEAVLKK